MKEITMPKEKNEKREMALSTEVAEMSLEGMANHLMKSGYFKDVTDPSKAIIKIMAGREVGLPAIASMMGLYIVEGKVTYSATMVGALIKRAGFKYTVAFTEENGGTCVINIRDQQGENLGGSPFSMKDAAAAGLAGKHNWKTYPRAMMFARALTQAGRWFCPEVFAGGPCYTAEELSPDTKVSEEGEVIDAVVVKTEKVDPRVRKREDMLKAFDSQGVTKKALEAFCGGPVENLTLENIEKLKTVFVEVRSGKRDKTLAEVKKEPEITVINTATTPPPREPGDDAEDLPGEVEMTDEMLFTDLAKIRVRDSRAFDSMLNALTGKKWDIKKLSRENLIVMWQCSLVKEARAKLEAAK